MIGFRDMACAKMINLQAELGVFAKEISVHGCGYLDKNNTVCYIVSEDPKDIYKFLHDNVLCIATKVHTFSKKMIITEENENEKYKLKLSLAESIRQLYSKEWYLLLKEYEKNVQNDDMFNILDLKREEMEGCFDEIALNAFEGLIKEAAFERNLSEEHYGELEKWIYKQKKQMIDDDIEVKSHKSTLYGFAYLEHGIKYYVNAFEKNVWDKRSNLILANKLASSILKETFWYGQGVTVSSLIKKYRSSLANYFNDDYMRLLKIIKENRENEKNLLFRNYLTALETVTRNESVIEDFKRYI